MGIYTTEPIDIQVRGRIGLLTEEEVAKILQLNSITTLATWRSQGKGPNSVKLGKRVFYTVNDLAQWVEVTAREQYQEKHPTQVAA